MIKIFISNIYRRNILKFNKNQEKLEPMAKKLKLVAY